MWNVSLPRMVYKVLQYNNISYPPAECYHFFFPFRSLVDKMNVRITKKWYQINVIR